MPPEALLSGRLRIRRIREQLKYRPLHMSELSRLG